MGGGVRAGEGGLSDVFCTVESEREKRGQRRKDVGSLEPRRLLLPHVSERSPPAESPEGAVEVGTRERERASEWRKGMRLFLRSPVFYSFCLFAPQFFPSGDGLLQPGEDVLGTIIWTFGTL